MKTTIKSLLILIASLQSIVSLSQFNVGPGGLYGRTDPDMQKIGIGNFPANPDVQAKLHVSQFRLNANAATNGLLFRTDGDQDTDNQWRLFTGTSATAQTERFRIRTLSGGYDTYLERTQAGSEADIRLLTAEVQVRARGKRLGDFCELAGGLADEVIMGDGTDVNFTALSATDRRLFLHGINGFLGIGSNFSEAALNPNYHVHVHESQGGVGVYQQFTNGTSGSAATDGLRLGLNANTSYEMRAYDPNIWLDLAQNNEIRMRFRDLNNWVPLQPIWHQGMFRDTIRDVNRIMVPLKNGDAVLAPISMMQLGTVDDGNIGRGWMNVGTTYGTNVDAMYVGWMERANPSTMNNLQSDAVIAWGCQRGASSNDPSSDNFRIIFLAPPGGMQADSAGTVQGKEVFRIEPFSGNTGIGNFSVSGAHPPGTTDYIGAKLDIDGDLRIRTLPDSLFSHVLLADTSDLNRIYRFPIDSLFTLGPCDWNVIDNSGLSLPNDLAMGYTGACNEGNVGIGDMPPADSRLFVFDAFGANNENAVSISASGSFNDQSGINVRLTNSGGNNGGTGVRSNVTGGKSLWAGRFTAIATSDLSQHFAAVDGFAQNNTGIGNYPIGVYGKAENTSNLGRSIGLYGEGYAPNGTGYSAYLIGTPVTTNPVLTLSDQSLKTNVQSISNASGILSQLKPCSYDYAAENSLSSALNGVQSMGFIAQEVQVVLPLAVEQFVHPGKWDEDGNQIQEDLELLGVKYDLFIPILVAGFQEQQATIAAQQAQIETLTALVNQCCTSGGATDKSLNQGQNAPQQDFDLHIEKATLNQNVPNPFQQETSITYRIPAQAMVRVRVMDAKGQQVDTLVDGLMPKGEYKIVWNASHLPSGLYFYTLEADGIELVKKAVKL